MTAIQIRNTNIDVVEYRGQRVVTLSQIDAVHHRPEGTARRTFNENKGHFIEGIDYFERKPSEAARELGIIAPNGLKLFTESGYLMLVKSFRDDLAWEVQRELPVSLWKILAKQKPPIRARLAEFVTVAVEMRRVKKV